MPILENKTKNQMVISNLTIADSFWPRLIGLMATSELTADEGLWIHRCNSIHTCFMRFPIDCVFVDKNLRVVSIKDDVKPWRLILPQFSAKSVLELKAGVARLKKIELGDQLYVGP